MKREDDKPKEIGGLLFDKDALRMMRDHETSWFDGQSDEIRPSDLATGEPIPEEAIQVIPVVSEIKEKN